MIWARVQSLLRVVELFPRAMAARRWSTPRSSPEGVKEVAEERSRPEITRMTGRIPAASDADNAVAGGIADAVPADPIAILAQVARGVELPFGHVEHLAGLVVTQIGDAVTDGAEGD